MQPIPEVTDHLLSIIRSGQYEIGDRLPSLDDLNHQFFGDDAGPRPGRAAYSPLIDAGLVEARQGRSGGHFLAAYEPTSATSAFGDSSRALLEAQGAIRRLAGLRWYVVDFQDIKTGEYFGESIHPNRIAAEHFAVSILTRLGEPEQHVRPAARAAGWTCADTSGTGFGIRIYAATLAGDTHVDVSGRR